MTKDVFTDYQAWLATQNLPKGQQAVLLASIDLFAKAGFNGTSTAQIAEAAGVSQATIFKYYKTKEALLMAIITPLLQQLFPNYLDTFFSEINEQPDLAAVVHFMVADRYQFAKKNSAVLLILLTELLTNQAVRDLFNDSIKQSAANFRNGLWAKIVALDELRPDLDLISFIRTLLGQIMLYFFQNQLAPASITDETADLKQIERTILRSLRK